MKSAPRPTIVEIAQGLQALGRSSVALDLVRAFGIKEVPTALPEKPKYQREKVRSAYIHVKLDVDADTQKKLLVELRESLSKKPEYAWLPACDSQHLLKIALPGPRVVYAYRVGLAEYLKSGLPAVIANSNHLEAYTRKPRADAQKHCLNQES